MFILGMFVGIGLEKPKFVDKIQSHIKHKRRMEFKKKWEGMYSDYGIARRYLLSGFTMEHFSSCQNYVKLFREKHWSRHYEQSQRSSPKFIDIYNSKMDESLELYRKLDKEYLDHFCDTQSMKRAENEYKRKNREQRLDKLIDK